MYTHKQSLWQKHMDFIVLDILSMQIAFVCAFLMRHGFNYTYYFDIYFTLQIVLLFIQISSSLFMNNYRDIIRRGYFEEFKKTFFLVSIVILCVFAYMFMGKNAELFSRIMFVQLWFVGNLLVYAERVLWKQVLRRRMLKGRNQQKIIVVSQPEHVTEILSQITAKEYNGFVITGILLEGEQGAEKEYNTIPVLGLARDLGKILVNEVVDEVFLDLPIHSKRVKEIQKSCAEMGITIHLNLGSTVGVEKNTIVENFAEFMVLTSSIAFADSRQLVAKRFMDIAGGVVGLLLTGLFTLFFGPIIFIQSPGPIFFTQERVGRNGRHFRIYKFRSMYLDAEERKKELMAKNKMQGLMFKMDDDPRIIPIGKFMRRTSLDEFPQFWNVLRGDMSLVGTRPPTVEEYQQYAQHHKARLAAKPGLTGMWQVSGRSEIVDFEEVVRLDKQYIEDWNIGLDLKILLQTVKTVLMGKGSV